MHQLQLESEPNLIAICKKKVLERCHKISPQQNPFLQVFEAVYSLQWLLVLCMFVEVSFTTLCSVSLLTLGFYISFIFHPNSSYLGITDESRIQRKENGLMSDLGLNDISSSASSKGRAIIKHLSVKKSTKYSLIKTK